MTHTVLIGLGILIAVLAVVAALGLLPSLRIVPDDTHFDFTRFRRISFPISALLSILAITLFFTHGLNFGIDFCWRCGPSPAPPTSRRCARP